MNAWAYKQLFKVRQQHPELVDEALALLLKQQPELNRLVVLGAYFDEQISLTTAAELLELSPIELQQQLVEQQSLPFSQFAGQENNANVPNPPPKNPSLELLNSDFIGCFEAEADLSANYKTVIGERIDEKYGHR